MPNPIREWQEQTWARLDTLRSKIETERVQQLAIAQSAVGFARSMWPGPQPLKPFHEEWLNYADSGEDFQLLAARDHFKTSVLTLIYPLYRIVKDPNIQIILISESSTQAQRWSRWLMHQIEQRFPWLSNRDRDKWTERQFTVPRTNSFSKDPTLEAVGILGRITGGHYDLGISDDVVSRENSYTQTLRDNVYDWFHHTLQPVIVPGGQQFVVGSTWHYDDLYAHNQEEGWETYRYPAVSREGKILFEERYTAEALVKKQEKMGIVFYNCQFLLDPKGLVGRLLKEAWLQYYETPPADLEIVQGVDLAISQKEAADYTAIVTVGYSPSLHTFYILDTYRGHLSFPEQLQAIQRQAETFNPSRIIVEVNAYQQALYQALRDTILPIIPRENLKDKVTRILTISGYFESKRILIRKDMHDFITEYLQFEPGSQAHDDLLDAMEMAVRDILARTQRESSKEPVLILGKPRILGASGFGSRGHRRLPKAEKGTGNSESQG